MTDEIRLRDEIARVGGSLFDRGLTAGSSGNISARLPDGGSGGAFGDPRRVVLISHAGPDRGR